MSQSDQTVVLLQEEYGFREWVWWTGMSEKELIAWWSALETVNPYFFDPTKLPGTLTPQIGWCRGGCCIYTYKPTTLHEDEHGEYQGDFLSINTPDVQWSGHIHCDDDSWLKKQSGERYTHKGRALTVASQA